MANKRTKMNERSRKDKESKRRIFIKEKKKKLR